MARLPSAEALGGLPSAGSGRQISSIDGSAVGQGMQTMARGMQSYGDGLAAQGAGYARAGQNIARGVDEFAKEQERHALIGETLLEGQRNIERMKLSERISTENNPDTIAQLRSGFAKIDENYAAKIPDPQRRALAVNKWQQQTAASEIDANSRHRQRFNDTVIDGANNILEEQRRMGVASNDPKVRQSAIDGANAQFDKLFSLGVIKNPEELKAKKRKFAEDFSFDRFRMLTPQERYEATQPVNLGERSQKAFQFFRGQGWTPAQAAGIVGNLIHESVGLNTGARNPGDGRDGSDSIGLAQWNSTRAVQLKAFAAQNKADWRDFNIQLAFVQHELNTTETRARDRLKEAKTPREAAAIIGETFLRPAGSGQGTPETMHGWKNRAKQSEAVASKFGGMTIEPSEGDRLVAMLPPEKQLQLRDAAERDYKSQILEFEREAKRGQQEWNSDFDTRLQNASSAALETGQLPDRAPTTTEFIQRYGEREGAEKAAQFADVVELGQNVQRLGQMPDAEAKAMIAAEKPDVNDPLFAAKQKTYELLQKAYTQDRAAREKDPAAYVQAKFPDLAQAWSEADPKDPAQTAVLMAKSQSYQRQLGIPEDKQQLLPGAVAARVVELFKNADVPQTDRINAVKSVLFATNDPAQQKAVFRQMEAAGIPGTFRAVLNAEARGDMGAARRLASAAMADPEKLKAIDPKKASPQMIDDKIRAAIFEPNTIGDAVYALSAGRAENSKRAKDDAELLRSYVRMEVAGGKDLDDAVAAGVKDIYGKVKVLSSNKALLAIPEDEREGPIEDGLAKLQASVRTALDARIPAAPPANAPAKEREAHRLAKLQVERSNIDLMATGQWRSFGADVAFIDSTTGLVVSDVGGKPLVFTMDQVKSAGAAPEVPTPAPVTPEKIEDLSKPETAEARAARLRATEARKPAPASMPSMYPPAPKQTPPFGGGSSRLPQ